MYKTLLAFLVPLGTVSVCFGQTAEEWFYSGVAKFNLKDYRGAIADYNKAIELDPTEATAYNNRGHVKLNLEDYRGAIADCNKAIELNPTFA